MKVSGGGWALAALSLLLLGLLAPDLDGLVRDVTGPSFPEALLGALSLLTLSIATWSLLTVVVVVGGGSSRVVTTITPTLLRRALLVGAAGTLVVGPAQAEQQVSPDLQARQQHSVRGLPLPDRPGTVSTAATAATGPAASTDHSGDSVEVERGDTLWGIAARSLPPSATRSDVARATTAWHDVNRDVIGDDPDLIFPGQRLAPPLGKDHP